MEFTFKPIGVIYSPFIEKDKTPIQASRSQAIGRVEIYPEFAVGLKDIEALSHIYLFYVFHKSQGYKLQVEPFLDDREHGIFATRYPYHPNPIGFSIVRLLSRAENALTVEGMLDIKPYVPDFDYRANVRAGWYETRSKK
jgi:tRNA-Thr(GGU) m(6)t(6)A37 methyltransferase TsaA